MLSFTENFISFPLDFAPGGGIVPGYALQGGIAGASTFNTRATQVIQMNWTGTDTTYTGAGGQVKTVRNASIRNSMNLYANERGGAGGGIYDYTVYEQGWLPNGINICTGDTIPPAEHTDAEKFNYYPRRFMDIAAYGSQILNTGITTTYVNTPAQFVGDCWVGTDDPAGANPQAKVYPMFCGMALDQFQMSTLPFPGPAGAYCWKPPFMTMGSSARSCAASGDPTIIIQGSTTQNVKTEDGNFTGNWPTAGLENSYFAFCTIPYEEMQTNYTATLNPSGREPLRYFFLNGLKFTDSTIGTGIFYNENSPFQEGTECIGFAFTGQVLSPTNNTPIPIKMANKWTGKTIQTRTFTVDEEQSAKNVEDAPLGPGGSPAGPGFFEYGNGIFNTRNGETVGIRNNYPRLGIEPFDENEPYDPALNEAAQQGAKTGEAAGVLGWRLVSDVENPVGGATEANILNSGLGYTTGIKTTFAVSGSGSGLTINVTAVDGVGAITTYTIAAEGSGYEIGDIVGLDGGGGVTATLTINQINRQTAGVEPTVFVMDSGGGWVKNFDFPVDNPNYSAQFNYSNARQDRGETFNSKILKDPNSNTRIAINCCWDNDRDQWIFLFGNYTPVVDNQGVSIMSVTSTFTDTPRFGAADLDQTENLGNFPTNFNSGLFQSFPMTNNLDGIIIFGDTNDSGDLASSGNMSYTANLTDDTPRGIYAKVVSTSSRAFPTQPTACQDASDPATIPYNVSRIGWVNLDGSTGREAFVWVDYILFDGADAVIATKLRERGMKVLLTRWNGSKGRLSIRGDLNIKQEEIEMWVRQQQDEFQMMMRDAERMGRVRKRKKQVSAYALDILDAINTDFEDKEVQEFMQDYLPKSRPPTPEEEMLERQRKGGYSPQSKSYFDEVFEQ